MDYKTVIANLTESKFLISMTPGEKIVEIGFIIKAGTCEVIS